MAEIKTLAMLKMEKNFAAVLEKRYPRKPYEEYTLTELFRRLQEEVKELKDYIRPLPMSATFTNAAKAECADVSNIIDYIFEKLETKEGGDH